MSTGSIVAANCELCELLRVFVAREQQISGGGGETVPYKWLPKVGEWQ